MPNGYTDHLLSGGSIQKSGKEQNIVNLGGLHIQVTKALGLGASVVREEQVRGWSPGTQAFLGGAGQGGWAGVRRGI